MPTDAGCSEPSRGARRGGVLGGMRLADLVSRALGPEVPTPQGGLEAAEANKHGLVSIKLGLEPGMRLLDVGCGWGGMVLHAAAQHGVRAVGVTISQRQADLARKRVADAGLADLVEIR